MMEEFTLQDYTFRIKKMNALELMALRDQIGFDSYDASLHTYNIILENVEVKVKTDWIQVKQKENFYPAGLEENVKLVSDICMNMIQYIKEVFTKSISSDKETELK